MTSYSFKARLSFWVSEAESAQSLLRTNICHVATMATLKEAGRTNVVEQIGETVSACLVEAKVPGLLSAGMGQVALEAVTIGAESTTCVGIWDISDVRSLTPMPYSDGHPQNVMVTDGDEWKFGVVDLMNKKVYFSESRHLNKDIKLVDLMALISIWTGAVSRI